MKLFYVTLFLLVTSNLLAQDYYYVEGNKIELTPRTDKIAIIINKIDLSESAIEQSLRTVIGFSDSYKKVAENLYLVTSKILQLAPTLSKRSFH